MLSLIGVFSTVVCFTMGICDTLKALPNGGDSELVIVFPHKVGHHLYLFKEYPYSNDMYGIDQKICFCLEKLVIGYLTAQGGMGSIRVL